MRRAIGDALQIADAVKIEVGLGRPPVWDVPTDIGEFQDLLCGIESSRKNGLLFCLSGRAMRLKPVPIKVPGRSPKRPRFFWIASSGPLARKTKGISSFSLAIRIA
jgi:hypothetical protein